MVDITEIFNKRGSDTSARIGQSVRLMRSLGSGLAAMANLASVERGAPSARFTKPKFDEWLAKESERSRDNEYLNLGRTRLAAAGMSLKERRDAQSTRDRAAEAERKAMLAEREQQRRDQMAEKKAAEIDSRIESRKASDTRKAARASKPRSSQGASRGGFQWVNPANGRTYHIGKSSWDKSAHSLFQIIVDDTRPAPDSRGYPSVEEWRRHCYDTYSGRDNRESYIIRNLPGSQRGLSYLERLGN